jgi:AcrR family transcriptional regulator
MSSATPAADSERPPGGGRPESGRLRADALRNREAVVAAARQVFAEAGLDAPLEEIARRAGVGIGTLYRRFPSRLDLVDAILTSSVEAHVRVAEEALAMADPWEGFVHFLTEVGRLQASDRGLNDMMSLRLPRATSRRRIWPCWPGRRPASSRPPTTSPPTRGAATSPCSSTACGPTARGPCPYLP